MNAVLKELATEREQRAHAAAAAGDPAMAAQSSLKGTRKLEQLQDDGAAAASGGEIRREIDLTAEDSEDDGCAGPGSLGAELGSPADDGVFAAALHAQFQAEAVPHTHGDSGSASAADHQLAEALQRDEYGGGQQQQQQQLRVAGGGGGGSSSLFSISFAALRAQEDDRRRACEGPPCGAPGAAPVDEDIGGGKTGRFWSTPRAWDGNRPCVVVDDDGIRAVLTSLLGGGAEQKPAKRQKQQTQQEEHEVGAGGGAGAAAAGSSSRIASDGGASCSAAAAWSLALAQGKPLARHLRSLPLLRLLCNWRQHVRETKIPWQGRTICICTSESCFLNTATCKGGVVGAVAAAAEPVDSVEALVRLAPRALSSALVMFIALYLRWPFTAAARLVLQRRWPLAKERRQQKDPAAAHLPVAEQRRLANERFLTTNPSGICLRMCWEGEEVPDALRHAVLSRGHLP